MSERYERDEDVIGALRLAVEGSTNARTLKRVVAALLEHAAPTTASATGSVWLLLEAVREINGKFVVNEAAPMGVVQPRRRRGIPAVE